MERFNTQMIAGCKQGLLVGVPSSKGEHALQTRQRIVLPLRNRLQRNFGVASSTKTAPFGLELLAQFAKIVYLAVKNQAVAPVGGPHWLSARGDVDHAQAPVGEPGWTVLKIPLCVWTTVSESAVHASQHFASVAGCPRHIDESA